MKAIFKKATITGIVTIIPPKQINIDDELNTIYKGDKKALDRIKKVIGLQTRNIADKYITASDLGEYAANLLIDSMNINRNTIDAIIMVTQTPDYFIPATACYLHGKLKLPTNTLAFDINQACAGYVYGLYVAYSMIESKSANKILMICGDTISRYTNPLDSNLAPIIGDGASASIIESNKDNNKSYFMLGAEGNKFHQLIIPKGASRIPTKKIIKDKKVWELSNIRKLNQLYMDGAEIFNFALQKEPEIFKEILKYSKIKEKDFDLFFFHQANKYIVDNITKRLNLPQNKVPNTTTNKYGNLSSCSIPASICDNINTKLLNTNLKVLLAGFGAGLSWGNAILTLNKNFFTTKVKTYKIKG